MNINQQIGLTLGKSNLTLLLSLCELGRNQTAVMINELEKNLEICTHEFESAAKDLLSAGDWVSVATSLGSMPLLIMRLQIHQIQKNLETWVSAQLRITSVSREAISAWQRETVTALQERAGAMPLSTTLRGFFGSEPQTDHSAKRTQPLGQLLPIAFNKI